MENDEDDIYELFQYFVAKLETRTELDDIYKFLLEFVSVIATGNRVISPSCIFLADQETFEFKLVTYQPGSVVSVLFEKEFAWQIDNGIVAFCLSNRKAAFSPAAYSGSSVNCLLVPLATGQHVLGLSLLYMTIAENDFKRESLQIITLACMQTALYVENLSMITELKNAQSRIIHSEKLSAIGQLAAGIAHEINNPASFVLSNCDALQTYVNSLKSILVLYESNAPAEVIERRRTELDIEYILQDIDSLITANVDGLNRVTQIVANLKDFAHLEQNEIFQLSNLEENLIKTLMIANNEIKYYAEVHTDFCSVPPVKCIPGEINQVFLNIIINAAQAIRGQAKNKRGFLTIRSYEDEASVFFEFIDDGPGIPENVLPKIFEPFYTTKPVGQGTGLGLNIAYDIVVNKHGGEIFVKSEYGNGTTFTVRLPKSG